MPWVEEVNGIVESWLGGQAGAGGTVDVLFGKVNPSGKLAETFPQKLEDTPAYFNFPGEEGDALYGERIFVGYRYYDYKNIEPLFPFGYGLSYTTFDYGDIKVSSNSITDKDNLTVSVKVKNTGNLKGKEVVQLYIRDPESRLIRPEKELKDFQLDSRDFSYYDSIREMWIAESGEFQILVGSSSREIKLEETVIFNSTQKVPLAYDQYNFFREYWNHPEARQLLKELLPNWIKSFTPEGKTADEAEFNDFLIDHPMIKFPYISKGEVNAEQINEFVEKCSNFTLIP